MANAVQDEHWRCRVSGHGEGSGGGPWPMNRPIRRLVELGLKTKK
jgi:hypothetical protein